MLDSLPDDVLVRIGITTAGLCGIRGFVALSKTSRRLKTLLLDSEETVQNVLALGTSKIHESLPLPLPPHEREESEASHEWVVQNLRQLRVYEHLRYLTLREESRILGIVGCSYSHRSRDGTRHSSSTEIFDAHDLHRCLVALTEQTTSTTVRLVDSAATTRWRAKPRHRDAAAAAKPLHIQKTKHYLHHDSYFCWQTVYRVLKGHLARKHERSQRSPDWISCGSVRGEATTTTRTTTVSCGAHHHHHHQKDERIVVRCWTTNHMMASEDHLRSSSRTEPPLVARRGPGWVEVFFNMNDHGPNHQGREHLDPFQAGNDDDDDDDDDDDELCR